jgi:hypothetical protein
MGIEQARRDTRLKGKSEMAKQIWGSAAVIAFGAFIGSVVIFLGIAFIMDAIYPNALAFGTILFIAVSAGAWYLANKSEKKFAANNPEQGGDHH